MTRTPQPDWDLLLIGGHSTSGKSTVARQSEPSPHTAHWQQLAWRYGQWLSNEAKQIGLPIVEPKPWATLQERIMMAI